LRDHIVEFSLLAADAVQGEVCLGLGKLNGWSLGPEWRKSHSHS
jgi:hypothetical protein